MSKFIVRSSICLTKLALLASCQHLTALAIEGAPTHIIHVEPGKTYQDKVIVRNDGDCPVHIIVKTAEYSATDAEIKEQGLEGPLGSNAPWVEVLREVELSPNARTPIPFKISVPSSAQAGTSLSVITLIETKLPQKGSSEVYTERHGDSCSVKLITFQDPIHQGQLRIVSSEMVRSLHNRPIWEITVINTGPVECDLKGVAQFHNAEGVLALQLPGDTHHIPAGGKAKYHFILNQVGVPKLEPGKYEATFILEEKGISRFSIQKAITL